MTARVALVTGAARGIGAATVRALADRGYSVVALDRGADDETLPYSMGTEAGLVELKGERVHPYLADVREPGALTEAVTEAERRFGGLDVAVAAAGVIAGGVPLWEQPRAAQQAVLEIDLHGVLHLATAAIPAMLRRPAPRTGRFLAVASAAATSGLPMLAAYCAAKAGVAGLVRALGSELGATGVTANAVSPGSTDTPILAETARLYGLPEAAAFAGQQPAGRLLEPEEIATVLAFLAGEENSAMTGAVVPVDGGLAL